MFQAIDKYTEPYRQAVESWYNDILYRYYQGDRMKEEVVTSLVMTVGIYWFIGLLYSAFDLTGRPRFFLRYKVQPIENNQVNNVSLVRLVKQVVKNQILASVIGFGLIWLKHKHLTVQTHVPSLTRFLYEWIVFVLIREMMFYYSHRVLHHPNLYRYIHKRHHEWQTPVAITAVYCHPIEHIVANLFPVLIGPALMNSHSLVIQIWLLWQIVLTLNDHSGYHFPFCTPPVFHDFHHLKFNVNYGALGLLDWLHGTDQLFRKSPYFKTYKMYFTLTPPKAHSRDPSKLK